MAGHDNRRLAGGYLLEIGDPDRADMDSRKEQYAAEHGLKRRHPLQSRLMTIRTLVSPGVILSLIVFVGISSVSGQSAPAKPRSWYGTIFYSSCNADEAFAESRECLKAAPGAKLALYDDTNRVMYDLEPQSIAAGHLGDSVTVRGTLDDALIHAASLELMSIGLAVGQKAPAFSAQDQFGHTQTLDSLKGPKGTVLLFFRSADW